MREANIKESIGHLQGNGLNVAIVVSRFNEVITKGLLSGAIDGLIRHGVQKSDIHVVWVPGAFEIPLMAKKMALTGRFQSVICLGAVIRGETPHFEYVSSQATGGVASAALETGIPILLGILTTDTVEQALNRAGTKFGNKGFEVAVNAIEMANLIASI